MLTLHRVRGVRVAPDGPPAPGHAVVVDGTRLAAIGPYEELAAAYGVTAAAEPGAPGGRARVREWDGIITPGRHEPDGAALLEAAYHPDPREAGALGSEPLTGAALAALGDSEAGMPESRWGASARRGLQRLLAAGTTSLTGPFTRPAVRTAVRRSGLPERPGPDPRPLTVGGPATFAIVADDGTALATVVAGRLVHRRR
ncbi:imidazolonepropionase-like domain-containing protein [Streptomyces lydicus]|uniref:imidazolonepropionase-like domain-containing protein n=1 Tax=Streptomyces lydicus TaxID=47763 RepID=UPI00379BD61F